MRRTESTSHGFSLMEVTTALGVISFALIALLGVFPLGLENSRVSVSETRGAQLSQMIFSTLTAEISTVPLKVECFSQSLPPLSLEADGTVYTEEGTPPEVTTVLYASYDPTDQPKIVRAESTPPGTIYTLDVTFRPRTFSYSEAVTGSSTMQSKKRVVGYDVGVRVRGLTRTKPFFEASSFVPGFQRAAYAK